MSDLISRQAAIDIAYKYKADIIAEEIEDLPSAQQWIPCSERLPKEDGGLYLVTDYAKSINRKRMHLSQCYINKEGFWSDVPIGYKVVAWMPLPEPYCGADMRGEENEY